jgi:hypothetical protein
MRYFRVVEDENRRRRRMEKGENENESERTYSSVGKSADTYFPGFTYIIYVFFFFGKSPLKVSILPESRFKAISVFYTVRGNGVGGHVFFCLEIRGLIFPCLA